MVQERRLVLVPDVEALCKPQHTLILMQKLQHLLSTCRSSRTRSASSGRNTKMCFRCMKIARICTRRSITMGEH